MREFVYSWCQSLSIVDVRLCPPGVAFVERSESESGFVKMFFSLVIKKILKCLLYE